MKIKPYNENNSFTDASRGIERIRTEFHGFMVEIFYYFISLYKIREKVIF